jgi:periplasmic protein CpxP/Spy
MYRFKAKHLASFLLASSAALGIAPAALAQAQPAAMHGQMGMHGGAPMRFLRGLNLTEAQHDQVFQIFHDQAPAFHEQMKQVRQSRAQLMSLASGASYDDARARQAADALAKAESAMALLRVQTMRRVRDVLTPEQRAKADEMMQRHRGSR